MSHPPSGWVSQFDLADTTAEALTKCFAAAKEMTTKIVPGAPRATLGDRDDRIVIAKGQADAFGRITADPLAVFNNYEVTEVRLYK